MSYFTNYNFDFILVYFYIVALLFCIYTGITVSAIFNSFIRLLNIIQMEEVSNKMESINEITNESKVKGKLLKEALKYKEKLDQRGVIYMSRIPPCMKPNKARSLFEKYGEITRLYLAEEDILQRKKRKDNGGNGSKQFNEGWIEFSDKKVAKSVAESLNNTNIGGKKGDFYHDDIWNLKYLKNFKWDYLTEKFAYEKRVKENKLKIAMMQAKRTNAEISEQMEQSIINKRINDRKRNKGELCDNDNMNNQAENYEKIRKKFKQTLPIGKDYGENNYKVQSSVLNKVFTTANNK